MFSLPNPVTTSDNNPPKFFGALKPPMARYDPEHVEALTNFLNALTRSAMTQNDTFRLLESIREQYGLPDPIEAFLDGLLAEQAHPAEPEPAPIPEDVTVYPMVGPSGFRWRPDGVPVYPAIPTYGQSISSSTPLTPDEALTRLHTMRPAEACGSRTYLGDAA